MGKEKKGRIRKPGPVTVSGFFCGVKIKEQRPEPRHFY